MALVSTDKFLQSALEYLANYQEVRDFVVYIQSEEFPNFHTIIERLKEYIDVSTFICMSFKPQSDGKNIFWFQLVTELLFSIVLNSSMTKVSTFMQS